MADVVLLSQVLDFGLEELNGQCDQIWVCTQQPTTFNEATLAPGSGGYALGVNDFGAAGTAFGNVADGTPTGRQVASAAVTDGAITTSGTVTAWAAVDSGNSRLLAVGDVASTRAVTSGDAFTLESLTIKVPAEAAVQGIVTSGLTHHWPMDDANVSGTTIIDTVGGLNGTANGSGVTSAVGPSGAAGTARQFDGTNYIQNIGNPFANMAANDYTVCAWVYDIDVTANGTDGAPKCWYNFTDGTNATGMMTATGASPAIFSCGALTGNEGGHDSTNIATSTTWFMISMTYIGGQDILQGNCFSAGTNVGGSNPSEGSSVVNVIGAKAVSGNSRRLPNGCRMGRILIYNRVLSAAELLQNYNAR